MDTFVSKNGETLKYNGTFTDIDGKVYKTYTPPPVGRTLMVNSPNSWSWGVPTIELNLEKSPQFVELKDRVIFLENEIGKLKKEPENNCEPLHKKPKTK